jgi:hypothetical protein
MMRKPWTFPVAAIATLSVALLTTTLTPSPASANSFELKLYDHPTGQCGILGSIEFVDNGPGREGGGNNDDYFWIHDYSSCDHDGIKAWMWLDGRLIDSRYNGNGESGAPVFWDPKQVPPGRHYVGVKVCRVDGNDGYPYPCATHTHAEEE